MEALLVAVVLVAFTLLAVSGFVLMCVSEWRECRAERAEKKATPPPPAVPAGPSGFSRANGGSLMPIPSPPRMAEQSITPPSPAVVDALRSAAEGRRDLVTRHALDVRAGYDSQGVFALCGTLVPHYVIEPLRGRAWRDAMADDTALCCARCVVLWEGLSDTHRRLLEL